MSQSLRVWLLVILVMLLAACSSGNNEENAGNNNANSANNEANNNENNNVNEENNANNENMVENDEMDDGADAPAGGRTFTVVTEESDAGYAVFEEFFAGAVDRFGVELGETTTVGLTEEVNGTLVLDFSGDAPTLVSGEFEVDISQLTSDQSRRDERIREQSLESDTYPIATFVASGMEGFPAGYSEGEEVNFTLLGDLTVRETTQPASFDVTATLQGDTITGTATTMILMTDFGFDPPSFAGIFTVGNEVTLTINITATEG